MIETRWVIHLPTTLTDVEVARGLAAALRESLGHVTVLDFGEVTLSEEDRQTVHHRVYCNLLLDGGWRCRLRDGHPGGCQTDSAPGSPRPAAQASGTSTATLGFE